MDPLPDVGHELCRPYFEHLEQLYGLHVIRHLPDAFVGILLLAVVLLLLLDEPHRRLVITRRIFVSLGLILCFRAYCVTVTSLPDMSPHCRQQFEKSYYWFGEQHVTGQYKRLPIFPKAFRRANKVFWNPLEDTCGDLMFSGHTVGLWVAWLTLYEYSRYRIVILLSFFLAGAGTVVIVGTMFHYTLDVSVAVFVTYTCWTLVHRYAKNQILQLHSGFVGQLVHWIEETEHISETKKYY